ncbi:S-DNA-T family DNA segregation ATPase FtsK/SpoIIIE [Pseudoclavibacter sp. JAI123]|uniref:FtsK/SpoIIIE domain-containing protein n=1 Tax=Pseudoclavibacter sp. JAI123 TaxID=2723065 RepID=UPI0015CCB862|nr:FtsK/SpoIIIE domain-containing protein [Pseudoclavibacter sp. JAI123]NYF13395.1 S-DNA-T family DNA segregation ATPase FtsK/SpoIIIE [Pseudoclavibacter sp. JAI123]
MSRKPPLQDVTTERSDGPPDEQARPRLIEPVLCLPSPVADARVVAFPIIMASAPVVVAILLWLLLGSPAMLAFALLGPVMAVASYAESRRQASAQQTRAQAMFDRELDACIQQARSLAADELRRLEALAAETCTARAAPRLQAQERFCLGSGSVRLRVPMSGELRHLPEDVRSRLDHVLTLDDAPVFGGGATFEITGSPSLVLAAGRALLVQHAACAGEVRICAGVPGALLAQELSTLGRPWRWGDAQVAEGGLLLVLSEGRDIESSNAAPVRVHVQSASAASVVLENGSRVTLRPRFMTAEQLRASGPSRSDEAGQAGVDGKDAGELRRAASITSRGGAQPVRLEGAGLFAELGTHGTALFGIDLVTDGPHAVIGGTTGSGKSELLVTWVLALTESRSTREVQVLCFDFKGGATFDPLAELPHCVGIVTDLDAAEAQRAAISLRAELRERERALRAAGATHIGQLPGLARLVVIVDEYQALVDAGAALHSVFADISSRGRSLGMHLVLCSQQPAIAVRGTTLANCSIRICLRVVADADSTALIGTASAARLPADSPGLALVVRDSRIVEVQVRQRERLAVAGLVLAAVEREAHLGHLPPQRPWLPALPSRIALAAIAEDGPGLAFGLSDDTDAREQRPARFDAGLGAMAVIGGPRTGKTGCLTVLVEASGERSDSAVGRITVLSSDPESAWDQLCAADLASSPGLLVVDDIDALLAGVEEPHRTAMTEHLVRLIKASASCSPAVAFSLSRVTGGTAALVASAAQTLRLVGGDRSAYVMAGGQASEHDADAPAGRAVWRGRACQVAQASRPISNRDRDAEAATDRLAPVHGETDRELLVVARQPATMRRLLEARGFVCTDLADWCAATTVTRGHPERGGSEPRSVQRAVIGDVETWQGRFGVLARLSAEHRVLLSGVTPGEHRSLLRGDPLPPLVVDASRSAVLRHGRGTMERIRWSNEERSLSSA